MRLEAEIELIQKFSLFMRDNDCHFEFSKLIYCARESVFLVYRRFCNTLRSPLNTVNTAVRTLYHKVSLK